MVHRKSSRGGSNFKTYISRTIKEQDEDPKMRITGQGVSKLNDVVNMVFHNLASEAKHILNSERKMTLTRRELASALKINVHGPMAGPMNARASVAVENYRKFSRSTSKAVSKSQRAKLVFPVGRVITLLRQGNYAKRVSPEAGVYMAGVLEFLAMDMFLAAKDEVGKKKKMVNGPAIEKALYLNDEIQDLIH